MDKTRTRAGVLLLALLASAAAAAQPLSLGRESLRTLEQLGSALRALQIDTPSDPDAGALRCPECNVLHTRAAEAVYPFAVLAKRTGTPDYADRARRLARWLISRQETDGSWKETPEEWTGTTTDQLLMLARAYELLRADLAPDERAAWERSMRRAADYLTGAMNNAFASINYCATSAAALATMHQLFPEERWAVKAKQLAWEVAAAMDEDGFISAEGERVFSGKFGSDIGYEFDMSLWGLALYAKLSGDDAIHDLVLASLKNHLYFVYPNGAIDGSWGIRSNKWTTYGSQTADGSQVLFGLLAADEPRGLTAAMRNLAYLRTMMRGGLVGSGPDFWSLYSRPCIYPTFARAKNLAMTVELELGAAAESRTLPADALRWARVFPTVDVAVVRTDTMMGTISAYRYKDLNKRDRSKYMHRPAGGALSVLWADGYGFLQVSSQTAYERWEPMHFPEAPGILSLTPRIEFENGNGYFTNLYEFDARMTVVDRMPGSAIVETTGQLCDKRLAQGGVGYTLSHRFQDGALEKSVTLRYRIDDADVRIVEPIVRQPGVTFETEGPRAVLIKGASRHVRFEVLDGDATVETGRDEHRYWAPFPAVRCYPIVLKVRRAPGRLAQTVTYRLSIVR
jgi:hypothetical protein